MTNQEVIANGGGSLQARLWEWDWEDWEYWEYEDEEEEEEEDE